MENKIDSKELELELESEIEELEPKIAPAGDDSVLPIGIHIRQH